VREIYTDFSQYQHIKKEERPPYQLVGRHVGLRACYGGAAGCEAGLGPARDGWPPTSALALLVKMAAVSIAATVVQSLSAQASVICRLLSQFAHTRAPRDPRRSARA